MTPNAESFEEQLRPLLTDLYYPSESDEPVTLVTCPFQQPEPLTVSQIKDWLLLPPDVFVEEIPEDKFWAPVTAVEDWYTDEERDRTARFGRVRHVVECGLTDRQVFRVGEIEVDVYLLGRLAETDGSGRAGLQTRVIET